MKLSQKLAMVLATAMFATSIPSVTMAATYTTVRSSVDMVYGDKFDFTTSSAVELSMKNIGNDIIASESNPITFAITGTDMRFSSDFYTTKFDGEKVPLGDDGSYFTVVNGTYTQYRPNNTRSTDDRYFTITRNSNDHLTVTLYQTLERDEFLTLPLAFEANGYNPSVSIQGAGEITSQLNITLGTSEVSRYNTSVSIPSQGYVSQDGDGNIGVIRLSENKAGAFNYIDSPTPIIGKDDDGNEILLYNEYAGVNYLIQLKNNRIEWDLNEGDYLYLGANANVDRSQTDHGNKYVNLTGGMTSVADTLVVQVIELDDEEMIINVVDTAEPNTSRALKGNVELVNLPVRLASRNSTLSLGELEVAITEVELISTDAPTGSTTHAIRDFESSNSVYLRDVIAQIVNEPILFQAHNEINLYAGQDAQWSEISMHEIIDGAINSRDKFYFTLNSGYFALNELNNITFDFDGATIRNSTTGNKIITGDTSELEFDVAALITAAEGQGLLQADNADEYTQKVHEMLDNLHFELKIGTKVSVSSDTDIKLQIESRNLSEDLTLYLGKSKPAFTVEAPPVHVNLGVKEQAMGTIVITEADEEMFRDGRQIIVDIEDTGNAINIKSAKVSTDGESGLEVSSSTSTGTIVITISEESMHGAGTITISDIEYDIWGGTPRGDYDLYIGGSAVDFANAVDTIGTKRTISDYLVVGTDVFGSQLVAQIDFTNGTATKNGSEVEMTATPFLSDAGRTMVGVRDLATFFNILEDNILFTSGGHVTIRNGNDLITMTNGSNIIYRNGQPIYMDEAMQIVDGRSYAPAKFVALALGLNIDYDVDTKVATFSN